MRAARQTRLPAKPRSGPGGDLDLMGNDCAGLSTLQSDLIDWLDGQKLFDVHVHVCTYVHGRKPK